MTAFPEAKAADETDPAPHSDVERLAASLDEMTKASRSIGVQLHRVERAAEMLRHLSRLLHGSEEARKRLRPACGPQQ